MIATSISTQQSIDVPYERPVWAPRVKQALIRVLYENDALGIYDDELIDEVGYGLYSRCRSFITANEAVDGSATCPRCDNRISHDGNKETLLICRQCRWRLTWGDYFATIQHNQLSGAEPVRRLFTEFVESFPAANTPQAKVLLIDRLLHGFHWYYKTGDPTRPVAVNLIEGRLREVIALLDDLSYSEMSTPGAVEKRAEWNRNVRWAREW